MNLINNENYMSPPLSAGDFVKDKPCLCFQPDESVCAIIDKMQESHNYAVAITNHNILIGLLTAQDILIRAASWHMKRPPTMDSIAKAFAVMKAADVMIHNPITVSHETPLDEVMYIITRHSFRYIPVMRNQYPHNQYPMGILNVLDVVKHMEQRARLDNKTKDEVLSYVMSHENYGCVSSEP